MSSSQNALGARKKKRRSKIQIKNKTENNKKKIGSFVLENWLCCSLFNVLFVPGKSASKPRKYLWISTRSFQSSEMWQCTLQPPTWHSLEPDNKPNTSVLPPSNTICTRSRPATSCRSPEQWLLSVGRTTTGHDLTFVLRLTINPPLLNGASDDRLTRWVA